jgi:hypothetical protein
MQGAALEGARAHDALFGLLKLGLGCGHGDAQSVALDVVARLWERGALQSAFSPAQQAALRQSVGALALSQDEQVRLALQGLEPLYQSPRGADV